MSDLNERQTAYLDKFKEYIDSGVDSMPDAIINEWLVQLDALWYAMDEDETDEVSMHAAVYAESKRGT